MMALKHRFNCPLAETTETLYRNRKSILRTRHLKYVLDFQYRRE